METEENVKQFNKLHHDLARVINDTLQLIIMAIIVKLCAKWSY